MIFLFTYIPAFAHNVIVFAWVEGDTVHTESKFSGGKKVKDGDIFVYDTDGNRLITGKTDSNGEFSFKIPKKTALEIVLQAGMGHQNKWVIPVEEIGGTADKKTETSLHRKAVKHESEIQDSSGSVEMPGCKDIQDMIDTTLDEKLEPINQKLTMLVRLQEKGPSIKDILGGIGYILGLVGVAAYAGSRRKKSE